MTEGDENGYDLETRSTPPANTPPRQPVDVERRHHREQANLDAAITAYRAPLVMLTIAAFAVCSLVAINDGFEGMAAYLLGYLVGVPVGVGVYLLCCHMWIGFDMPVHLIAINLAAVYAVTDLVDALLNLLPFGGFLWPIPILVYIALLAQRLEIEFIEAIVVGMLTFLVKLAVAILIMQLVMR